VEWDKVATEALKLSGGALLAVVVGWLAHQQGWIGQKEWDTAKLRYELFKEAMQHRLDLLSDMEESSRAISNNALVAFSAEMIALQLVTNSSLDATDLRVKEQLERSGAAHAQVKEAVGRLQISAARFGVVLSSGDYTDCYLPDVLRTWKKQYEQAWNKARLEKFRSNDSLSQVCLALTCLLHDIKGEEHERLLQSTPDSFGDPFPAHLSVRVFHDLRPKK
jgi:hypothetical protein